MTIHPEEGNFPWIAKALLAVADHPNQVVSISHPRAGFQVPTDVYERFEAAQEPSGTGAEQVSAPAQAEPSRRRPGRPRKNLLSPEELQAAIAAGTPGTGDDASKEE